MNLFFQPLCCLASCHFSLLYPFPWFLSITDMGQLLRIISNADISDRMSHMVCHLGLAEFPLPPCPMVCRCVMNDPLACLFPHRQFNRRNRKESINPCTMSVSLGGLSHYSFPLILLFSRWVLQMSLRAWIAPPTGITQFPLCYHLHRAQPFTKL